MKIKDLLQEKIDNWNRMNGFLKLLGIMISFQTALLIGLYFIVLR